AALEAKETRRVERTKRPILRPALMAACVAVLIAVGAAFHDDLLLPLASDHRTAVGERTPIALADGSRVTLNTDTAIAVDLETKSRRVRLLQGEAWFDVAADGFRPFVVETPAGLVRVTGTSFGVRLHRETAVVSLTEGNVELMAENDEATTATPLGAGHRITFSPAGVSAPTALDKTTATAWLRGQMVFFDARLADVIAELNRYRSGRIVITNSDLGDLRINGVFSTDDPDAALDAIANTLPVRIMRLTDLLILLH
ncbi:MAG: FecR domain-containing protein, partial [Pseudomonadota bacterium]